MHRCSWSDGSAVRGPDRVMKPQLLAVVLGATALAATIASVPLSLGEEPIYNTVTYTLVAAAFAVTGTLVAVKVKRNPIGWIMIVIALMCSLINVLEGWGQRPELPASDVAGWSATSLPFAMIGMLPVLLMIFPTGVIPSRRWRFPFWLAAADVLLSPVASAFSHSVRRPGSDGPNPIAVDGPVADVITAGTQLLIVVSFISAVAALASRYRVGGQTERQQLKWVAFATALFVIVTPFAVAAYYASPVVQIGIAVAVAFLPIAITIAVLRFRLYDIDRIISRGLSYAVVTALVIGAYALVVVAISAILPKLPSVSVALATLAAAALFLPVLRRVQRLVDRRFDRARYSAQKVVDAFGERLRNDADPHTAAAELGAAVDATLQPVTMGVWLPQRDANRS